MEEGKLKLKGKEGKNKIESVRIGCTRTAKDSVERMCYRCAWPQYLSFSLALDPLVGKSSLQA